MPLTWMPPRRPRRAPPRRRRRASPRRRRRASPHRPRRAPPRRPRPSPPVANAVTASSVASAPSTREWPAPVGEHEAGPLAVRLVQPQRLGCRDFAVAAIVHQEQRHAVGQGATDGIHALVRPFDVGQDPASEFPGEHVGGRRAQPDPGCERVDEVPGVGHPGDRDHPARRSTLAHRRERRQRTEGVPDNDPEESVAPLQLLDGGEVVADVGVPAGRITVRRCVEADDAIPLGPQFPHDRAELRRATAPAVHDEHGLGSAAPRIGDDLAAAHGDRSAFGALVHGTVAGPHGQRGAHLAEQRQRQAACQMRRRRGRRSAAWRAKGWWRGAWRLRWR